MRKECRVRNRKSGMQNLECSVGRSEAGVQSVAGLALSFSNC